MPCCSASERSALSSETGKRTVWRTSLNARLHRDSDPLSPKMAEDHHSWEGEKRRCRIAISKTGGKAGRSEEHTSELQSLMRISYAVFCLKKKKHSNNRHT